MKHSNLFLTWSFLSFCILLNYHSVLGLVSICFYFTNYICPISIIIILNYSFLPHIKPWKLWPTLDAFAAAQIISDHTQCTSQFCVLFTQTLQKSDFNYLKKNSKILLMGKYLGPIYLQMILILNTMQKCL